MSRKTSIVTSAADGCGKPQSARSAGGSKSLSCGAEGTIRARTGHSAARWGCSLAAAGLTATAVLLVAIPPARANLININGVNSYGPNSPGSPAPTGTAGAVVSGQMQWNNLAGVETTPGTTVSITNLVDTNGALTNIGLSLTTSGGSYTSNLASMNAMLSSYPAEDGTSTATFSGLDPSGNTTYNLYVYNWWGWGAGNDSTSILASGGTPPRSAGQRMGRRGDRCDNVHQRGELCSVHRIDTKQFRGY